MIPCWMLSFKSLTVPIWYLHPLVSKQYAIWVGAAAGSAGAVANKDDLSSSVSEQQDQSWIMLALSRAKIDSDVRVLSRQHCSSCTVMCHHWQTAACPWLVLISPSLACRSTLRSSLLSIMWSYAMGILCNSLLGRWLINQLKNSKNVSKSCAIQRRFLRQ